MAKDYSEDLLIQKSTAELLEKDLGWKSVYAFDNEVLGEQGTLGRKTQSEVVLTRHLRLALKRLNPWMSDKQLTEAIERMTSYMSSQTLMQINEEKYGYLRDGVLVTRQKSNGETETVRAHVLDFAHVNNNEFIAVRELWIKGPIHKRRADVVCFVNGLPLLFIELKNVAIDLLAKIKHQLACMDHPFDKRTTRATLIITIRDTLWQELPESYSEESINYYRNTIYNYVNQRYGGMA